MERNLPLKPFVFSLPLLIILFLFTIPRFLVSGNIPQNLSMAILLDLLITVPLVYYLIIRKRAIPVFTVIYPFLLGILVAGFIIPPEHQYLLSKIKAIAIPVIELAVISTIIYKIWKLNATFKKTAGVDFYDKLLIASDKIFPGRIGSLLASEIAVFYYLFQWNKKPLNKEFEFSYHKKSGIISVIGVFIFLLLIETFAVHVLVETWNTTIAWILSFLSIYTMFQIISILRSMFHRPIFINYETETLHLNYGFACYTRIPFHHIANIELTRRTPSNDSHVALSVFDLLDTSNLIITLNTEQRLHKFYGMKKDYRSISLFIDEKEQFAKKLQEIISRNQATEK